MATTPQANIEPHILKALLLLVNYVFFNNNIGCPPITNLMYDIKNPTFVCDRSVTYSVIHITLVYHPISIYLLLYLPHTTCATSIHTCYTVI